MVCTNDKNIYEVARSFRSHGMAREMDNKVLENKYIKNTNYYPQNLFLYPGFNFRSNEISALIGINQLKRLDKQNKKEPLI